MELNEWEQNTKEIGLIKCSYLIWNEPYQVILIANGLYI